MIRNVITLFCEENLAEGKDDHHDCPQAEDRSPRQSDLCNRQRKDRPARYTPGTDQGKRHLQDFRGGPAGGRILEAFTGWYMKTDSSMIAYTKKGQLAV